MSKEDLTWAGVMSPFVFVVLILIVYAVIGVMGRRKGRRVVDNRAARERELLKQISQLEVDIAYERQKTLAWMASSTKHSERAGELLKIIHDLRRENEAMARKPLTEAQLKECLEAGGTTCPRCGDDDNLTVEDITADETDIGVYFQDVSCSGCNEPFRLVFTLTKVVSIED